MAPSPFALPPRPNRVTVVVLALASPALILVLYLIGQPPSPSLSFESSSRLESAPSPPPIPDGVTIGERLIVSTDSAPDAAPYDYAGEFAAEAAAAPALAPRRPNEAQRQFPFPFVTGDLFRFAADFVYDELGYRDEWTGGDLTPCATVFVKNDRLGDFFARVWPAVRVPVVLITHNGDEPAPGPGAAHLDDGRLVAWFAQNVAQSGRHAKLRPIPIGLANAQWPTGQLDAWRRAAGADLGPWRARPDLLFISWTDGTHPDRARLKQRFRRFTPDTVVGQGGHAEFVRNLTRAKFVLSPPGNGIDCHRHWEAILMGAVPIVLRSGLDPILAQAAAVVVDDYDDLSEELLRALRPSPTYDRRVVWANHWLGQIRDTVRQCQSDPPEMF